MAAKEKVSLDLAKRSVLIQNLLLDNQDVFAYLEDKKDREEVVKKALVLGVIGLKSMGIETRVDYIDKRFAELMKRFDDKIDRAFDSKNPESPVGQLYVKINDTFDVNKKDSPVSVLNRQLEEYFDDKNGTVRRIINENFDVNKKDSPMGLFMSDIDRYFNKDSGLLKQLMEKHFDVNDRESSLGYLMYNLDAYFSDEGAMKKLLESHFDLDSRNSSMSQFVDRLSENFDVDKGTIRLVLDPNREGSPINQLKKEIMENFREVRDKLAVTKAEGEVMEKSTQKGSLFEDQLYEQLQYVTNPYGDTVESVGKIAGTTGLKGDFVVTLRGSDERIVVEAKDASGYTIPRTISEIEDAMENRRAKFGIFVFKNHDQMPRAFQPCKVARNYIITTYDSNGMFYAYQVAKTVVESELSKSGESIQVDKIQAELEYMLQKTLVVEEVLRKTRLITQNVDSIESILKSLQAEVEDGLKRIQRYVRN